MKSFDPRDPGCGFMATTILTPVIILPMFMHFREKLMGKEE